MKKGFTLLEILLVIAAIGILAAIVIVAINPGRQLAQARNANRNSDLNTIYKALEQYNIDEFEYPSEVTSTSQELCVGGAGVDCTGLLDLYQELVEGGYLAQIPQDPSVTGAGTGYEVFLEENSRVALRAAEAELEEAIVINTESTPSITYATGIRDTTFDVGTGFNTTTSAVLVQDDEKIIVGGNFANYQGVGASRIVRINSDGSRDTTFDMGTGFNNSVSSMVLQDDGKIVVAGEFSTYQGVAANRIVRLNSDGSRDTTFNVGTGFNAFVESLAIQDDSKIVVGGRFTSYSGGATNYIARINTDGSRDTSLNVGSSVNSSQGVRVVVVQNDNKIIIGGAFSTYQGTGSNDIVRINTDGSLDTSFAIGSGFSTPFSTSINDILIQDDGKILVGGVFDLYRNQAAKGIVRINTDGSRDTSFDVGVGFDGGSGIISFTLQNDGKILAVGSLSSYQGTAINDIIRLNSDASHDTSFEGSVFNSFPRVVVFQDDGKLIVGGSFASYDGFSTSRLVRLE